MIYMPITYMSKTYMAMATTSLPIVYIRISCMATAITYIPITNMRITHMPTTYMLQTMGHGIDHCTTGDRRQNWCGPIDVEAMINIVGGMMTTSICHRCPKDAITREGLLLLTVATDCCHLVMYRLLWCTGSVEQLLYFAMDSCAARPTVMTLLLGLP